MSTAAPKYELRPEGCSAESESVREFFESTAPYWEEVYGRHDVVSVIYQERRDIVLSVVDMLPTPARSDVLEIGCGAGSISIALARRGHAVKATDLAAPMLGRTRKLADEAGVGQFIETHQCDTRHLPFPDNSFNLVMAIGVLPWLSSLLEPMREMIRVLQPGGYLIVTVDNRYRMSYVLHPSAWARLVGIRLPGRPRFRKRYKIPPSTTCSVHKFDALLPALGLEKLWGATLGFGPFYLLNRVLPQASGVKLHHALQSLADRRVPLIRSAGAHYIALSRKVKGMHI
jgi:ubiquinone/menaquinone biosynthesis C-methylase UbiE